MQVEETSPISLARRSRTSGRALPTRDAPPPFVSVIVPVLATERLSLCIDALAKQSYPAYEVILVDNGVGGGLAAHVAGREGFRLAQETRRGSYAARNAGLGLARGTVLAFTDADCVPAHDWIERGVAGLQKNPGCGLIGGQIDVTVAERSRPTAVELYEQRTSFRQADYIERWGFAATANLFTWREVFDHVGRFSDELLSMGDREWGTRVSAAGYTPAFASDVVVVHPARATLSALRTRTQRTTGGFMGLILKKRWSLRSIARDVPLGLLPTSLRARRGRAPLSAAARLKVLSVSGFVLAVRALEVVRLASGGEPVNH